MATPVKPPIRTRQPSIHFSDQLLPIRPISTKTGTSSIRGKSPPLKPQKFEKGVSFDTFDKKGEPTITSFTFNKKHVDFAQSKSTRTFLCGIDDNDYSNYALEWLLDELVDDNDEIICLRVVDKDSLIAGTSSMEKRTYQEEAIKLMTSIEEKNHDNKAISLTLEFAVGKVEKMIMQMIKLYEPSLLVVGTKGRNLGGIQGLLPGSISKYCLQSSPIPVIVVRPNSQRARGKRKRQADRSRQQYRDLLDKSGSDDKLRSVSQETLQPADGEAAAVAAAIGFDARESGAVGHRTSPLVNVVSASEKPIADSGRVEGGEVKEVDGKGVNGKGPETAATT